LFPNLSPPPPYTRAELTNDQKRKGREGTKVERERERERERYLKTCFHQADAFAALTTDSIIREHLSIIFFPASLHVLTIT
jgi:hypothetical protein